MKFQMQIQNYKPEFENSQHLASSLRELLFAETSRQVADFVKPGGVGQQLRSGLVDRSRKLENWFNDWWLDMAYLEYRERLPVWSSPGIPFPAVQISGEADQGSIFLIIRFGRKIFGQISFQNQQMFIYLCVADNCICKLTFDLIKFCP
jgi:hypothetical protein